MYWMGSSNAYSRRVQVTSVSRAMYFSLIFESEDKYEVFSNNDLRELRLKVEYAKQGKGRNGIEIGPIEATNLEEAVPYAQSMYIKQIQALDAEGLITATDPALKELGRIIRAIQADIEALPKEKQRVFLSKLREQCGREDNIYTVDELKRVLGQTCNNILSAKKQTDQQFWLDILSKKLEQVIYSLHKISN